jgi:4-hydroxybenzoate polyprenyltransferase/phosphoserine phosphatase
MIQPDPVMATARPLCVDLDGTLVKSDTLTDSVLVLARSRPALLLQLPFWLARGRAALKARITQYVTLDVAHLPYNRELLGYLEQEHAAGRKLYLATGADQALARRVAAHLGIFEEVLASDGGTNLTGSHKLDGLKRRFADGQFDYIGNAAPDLPLLAEAGEAMLANPGARLRAMLRSRHIGVRREFCDRPGRATVLAKAIRLHQWTKNVLMFVPLLLAHDLALPKVISAVLAFLSLSLFASAAYIVNDLLDIEADRRHPRKRNRPFAAGDLSPLAGLAIVALFVGASLAAAHFLPGVFLAWLVGYLATSLLYSFLLKRIVLVDVIILAGLYTLRMMAGGSATGTPISHWLVGFSAFLFLSLAMVKRYSELQNNRAGGTTPLNGRGYLLADIDQLRSFGTSSAYASVVVFGIYISAHDVEDHYAHPERLWLLAPLMILWLSRVWLLASRGQLDEDPVIFALTDRMSLLLGVAVVLIVLLAMWTRF